MLLVGLCCSGSIVAGEPSAELELSEPEKLWLIRNHEIRVAPDYHYEPIEFIADGKHAGMSADYYALFSEMLGVEFIVVAHEKWSDALIAMDSGETDLLSIIQKTPQRAKKYDFTTPFMELNSVMITDKTPANKNLGIEDLNGKKLAIVEGYFWEDLVKTDYPEINIVPVKDIASGLQQTALGTVDAFLDSFATSSYYITKQEITNLRVAGEAPYKINYSVAVRKDWPEFTNILNKAIAAITPEQHASIRKKWIKLDYEPPLLSKNVVLFLLTSVALISLILLASIIWVKTLQHKVREKTIELLEVNLKLEHIVENRTQDLRRANNKLLSNKRVLTSTNEQLTDEVNRDNLTQIPNRKRLKEFLATAWKAAQENSEPLSIIMADIDYFKALNDHYGHLIGDDCLREVASCMSRFTKRGGEFVARVGGDEFVLVLPKLNSKEALEYAELLQGKIRDLTIENINSPVEMFVTLSMGIASRAPNDKTLTEMELIDQCDKALYKAKKQGRNQAVVFSA